MKDATWIMFNKKVEEAIKEKNWIVLGITYYEMAVEVEKEGTDASYLREQGYLAKLKDKTTYLDNRMLGSVEILSNDPRCEPCKKQQGKVLSAEDARMLNPIPVKDCKNPVGCRCTYLPVLD